MASGSSGRANPGSKGFDFGTDDILCSYDDYANQDSSNGSHSDPTTGDTNSTKDFHKVRMARPSIFPSGSYSPPDDSFNHDMTATVEKVMKKYTDNLMRFLEGISSRLSQLELYCYNLDKSIKEMRSDLVHDNGEADTKLKSLEKHLQEVHRSVQILRDKQELAETQKELAKLQTGQKESSSLNHSQSSEERVSTPKSDPNKTDNTSDMQNQQQLALALPHEVAPPHQQPLAPPPQPQPQVHPQNMSQQQQQSYYMPQTQLPAPQPPAPTQHAQNQYLSSDPHYRSTQSQPAHSSVNQAPAAQTYSQYPQQWPQQQMQQPSGQQPMRPPAPSSYPPYPPTQPTNQPPVEALPNNIPVQMSFSVPQPLSNRSDGVPYGYNSPGRTVPPQHPPQQIKNTYGTQPGDGYAVTGPHPALPPGNSYMIYDNEGGRTTHHPPPQPHFLQSGYPPTNAAIQNQQLPPGATHVGRNPNHPQLPRNHPYSELTEKLMSMGFRGDHVANVIQRMEDSGQPVDFNSVLDRLDAHSSGGSQNQRVW